MFFFRAPVNSVRCAASVAIASRAAAAVTSWKTASPQVNPIESSVNPLSVSACESVVPCTFSVGAVMCSRPLLAPKRKAATKATATSTPAKKKAKKSTSAKPKTKTTTKPSPATPRRSRKTAAAPATPTTTTATLTAAPAGSLASFSPAIAATWVGAASSKMLQPQHVTPRSRKLVWWLCPSCSKQFNRRIDLNVAAGGECPQCHVKPSLPTATTTTASGRAPTAAAGAGVVVSSPLDASKYRCRPDNSLSTLNADNANRIKKSVADASYLRTTETRNLQPMLAKNYSNESKKIGEDEVVLVSPKLDGIRCVVSYNPEKKALLFFSRAGTLFECCDAKIEPTLRVLFEKNPYLVLDGELYNDSANVAKMKTAAAPPVKGRAVGSSSSSSAGGDEEVLDFQALTSAIRTTRDRRTPEVAALQAKLQYHVFDVLYTSTPDGTSSVALSSTPYTARYQLLQSLFATLKHTPASKAPAGFDVNAIRLVPSLPFLKAEIDDALESAIQYGYEGVMVRRDDVSRSTGRASARRKALRVSSGAGAFAQRLSAHDLLKRATRSSATSATAAASGGYGYGQRSSSLLKYKRMQDAEYVIIGAVEGKGKWKDSLGAFVCTTPNGKHVFTVTPASTDEQKRRMWKSWQKEYKGKALTVQFQELTADGVPRFPVGKSVRGAANGSDWI